MHTDIFNRYFRGMRIKSKYLLAVFVMLSSTSCSLISSSDSPAISITDCSQYENELIALQDELDASWSNFKDTPSDANRLQFKVDAASLLHYVAGDQTGCATAKEIAEAQAQLDQVK